MNINIYKQKEFLDYITNEMTKAARIVMIAHKVPKQSKLIKSIEFEYKDNLFVLMANNYYVWLDSGRKRGVRKVPIQALLKWIKDYRIQRTSGRGGRFKSNNSLAFAIQTSIYKNGIKGRKYSDAVEEATLDVLAENSVEFLAEITTDAMYDAFTKV